MLLLIDIYARVILSLISLNNGTSLKVIVIVIDLSGMDLSGMIINGTVEAAFVGKRCSRRGPS